MPLFQKAVFLTTVAHLRDLPADSVREVAFAGRGDIARIGGIGHDEHLERRVNIPEGPFFEVLLNLVEGFPVGMAAVLQFNLDHGKAVNQQGDIAPAVPVHLSLAAPDIVLVFLLGFQ